jgi:hypothetical protein
MARIPLFVRANGPYVSGDANTQFSRDNWINFTPPLIAPTLVVYVTENTANVTWLNTNTDRSGTLVYVGDVLTYDVAPPTLNQNITMGGYNAAAETIRYATKTIKIRDYRYDALGVVEYSAYSSSLQVSIQPPGYVQPFTPYDTSNTNAFMFNTGANKGFHDTLGGPWKFVPQTNNISDDVNPTFSFKIKVGSEYVYKPSVGGSSGAGVTTGPASGWYTAGQILSYTWAANDQSKKLNHGKGLHVLVTDDSDWLLGF